MAYDHNPNQTIMDDIILTITRMHTTLNMETEAKFKHAPRVNAHTAPAVRYRVTKPSSTAA